MSKKQSNSFPLAEYTDELAEKLRGLVHSALHDGEVDAIHQARVTTRRLRAALDLLEPVVAKQARKPIGRTLKKLRKQLGPLRDLDVMLGHLDELARHSRHAAAVQWFQSQLKSRRQEAGHEALTKAPPAKTLSKLGAWWGVREEIGGARETIDALLADSLNGQIDEFSAAADAMLKPQAESPANPHAVRIAGKLLRYTVEMAAVEGHKLPGGVLKTFKKMQDALGLWHDFVVLTETAMEISVEENLAVTDAAMQQGVLGLAGLTLKRSQIHMGKFAELWKESGESIGKAIREAFPRQETEKEQGPVSEPKTDPDPADSPAPQAQASSVPTDPAAA